MREGRGSGSKGSPTHLYRSSRGASPLPHTAASIISSSTTPANTHPYTTTPGWVWCETLVATLSLSQLGKGLLESTPSSQEQGGSSPTPGAACNHHKHPAQAWAGSSCVGRLQVCRQERLFVLKQPEITHTRNTSRSPASLVSP